MSNRCIETASGCHFDTDRCVAVFCQPNQSGGQWSCLFCQDDDGGEEVEHEEEELFISVTKQQAGLEMTLEDWPLKVRG